jgi:GntR family transcriptional regulator
VAVSESRRIADDLRAAILNGEYADGDRLPSQSELARQYGVTIDIARQAIVTLRAERLIETRHGSGAFVSRFPLIVRSSPNRLSRSKTWGKGRAVQDADTEPRPRTVDVVVEEIRADEFVARALEVAPGTWVLSRSRRFVVDDRPVQLATSYLPLDIVRGTAVTYTDSGPGGIYARLAELGYAPASFTERVTARAPYPDERARLELPAGSGLVFEIHRNAYTKEKRCVELNLMVLDAAAYELEYAFRA